MGQDTFFELTRRSVPIIKNEAAFLSWRDSVMTVRTSKRLNFLEYSYNLECLDRKIDLLDSSVASPKNSPASELFKAKFLKLEMRNVDYTEMIVNPSFWPHNQTLTQEQTAVTMCKWSPSNFINNTSVLAVLNNIGGTEFFGQHRYQWKSLLNLSPYIMKSVQYNNLPECFEELKKAVYIVETSSICWAPELNLDNSCYFVTAQKDGSILFWQIYNDMNTVSLQGSIQTDIQEISRMIWIPKSQNQFWLICTSVSGQIYAFNMKVENNSILLEQQHIVLWPHNDRMIAISLNYTIINNQLILICSKHRHLLIQVISNNGTVLSQYLNNVNDYRITDITSSNGSFYLSTVNVKIYKININFINNKLDVDLVSIELKDQYSNYDLHSLQFSRNNVMCALAVIDRKVLCRKEAHKMEILFLSTDTKLESLVSTLLNNPSKKLTNYWDCIELLRFHVTKMKFMPKIDYEELFAEGLLDPYKLKIYLILVIFYSNLKKMLRVCSDVTLPETSVEAVKEKILYLHAQSIFNALCNKCQTDGVLSDFDMESLYGSKNYLEFYSKKYKISLDLDKNFLDALDNNCEYVCQCCDGKIEGFSCSEGHLNMFCMDSFTPISNHEYLVCRCCNFTARSDLSQHSLLCVFCDLHLVKPE